MVTKTSVYDTTNSSATRYRNKDLINGCRSRCAKVNNTLEAPTRNGSVGTIYQAIRLHRRNIFTGHRALMRNVCVGRDSISADKYYSSTRAALLEN